MNTRNGGFACPEREAALQALLFGELGGPEKKALERHLDACPRCRQALAEAKHGLEELSHLDVVPLPYHEPDAAETEPAKPDVPWVDFQARLRLRENKETPRRFQLLGRSPWGIQRVAAAAALVLIGFLAGRWEGFRSPSQLSGTSVDTSEVGIPLTPLVEEKAVNALARAEILSDAGLRYVNGLRELMRWVMGQPGRAVALADLALTRERARELVRDGRLLRRNLDKERDEALLAALSRAELFLEDLAALDADSAATSVRVVEAEIRESRLPDGLASLNAEVEKEVARALEISGWIGEELVRGKEF